MYKIIGNDGKTYGPIGAEKIREWIAQGRADARTAAIAEGAADWTFLGLLPEFARELAGTPPVIAPPKTGAVSANNTNSFATAGFVCGLISLTCCCGCPFNILGLIFSIVALVQINGQVQKQDGWGLALAGLICSAVSLLVSFGLGILQLVLHPANLSWHFGAI
jgi:Domain of unknown function (DUF4190)/GYF domain 2